MPKLIKVENLEITVKANRLLTPSALLRVNRAIKGCLTALLKKKNRLELKKSGHYLIHIEMVTVAKMTKLNKIFRGKDGPTDVLTFARWEVDMPAVPLLDLGDVIVAPGVGRKQAARFENTYLEELERLTVHGLLHLFGYDHELGPREAKEMFILQEKILAGLKAKLNKPR